MTPRLDIPATIGGLRAARNRLTKRFDKARQRLFSAHEEIERLRSEVRKAHTTIDRLNGNDPCPCTVCNPKT